MKKFLLGKMSPMQVKTLTERMAKRRWVANRKCSHFENLRQPTPISTGNPPRSFRNRKYLDTGLKHDDVISGFSSVLTEFLNLTRMVLANMVLVFIRTGANLKRGKVVIKIPLSFFTH